MDSLWAVITLLGVAVVLGGEALGWLIMLLGVMMANPSSSGDRYR